MSQLCSFHARDLFSFNNVNLDNWTETYNTSFYLHYLSQWPDLSFIQRSPTGRTMGYVIGKGEGLDHGLQAHVPPSQKERHGHVTAITIAPEYRRIGLAERMMRLLEDISARVYHAYFVDLFVRPSNATAVHFYEKLGYSVYRMVTQYYSGGGKGNSDEDAFDMRKAMPRDEKRDTVRANGRQVAVDPRETIFTPARRFER